MLLFQEAATLAILDLDKPEVGVELGLSPYERLRLPIRHTVR